MYKSRFSLNNFEWTTWASSIDSIDSIDLKWDCIHHHPSSSIIHHHPSSMCRNFPTGTLIIAPNGAPRLADIAPLSMQTIQEFLVLRLRTCSFGELWVSQRFSLRTCHQQLTNNDNRIFPKALQRRRSFFLFRDTRTQASECTPGYTRVVSNKRTHFQSQKLAADHGN
jgi:hypothetical protein